MNNPWNNIKLDDYENHMKLDSVQQLQTLHDIMYRQFYCYPASTIMILGIAGGNGLDHIDRDKIQTVYGIDINRAYLEECIKRYPALSRTFVPIHADLRAEDITLPEADIVVANLLVEYIGYDHFQRVIQKVNPLYVTCVIQMNIDSSFVSYSPYLHLLKGLEKDHHQVCEHELFQVMSEIGYKFIYGDEYTLPNGKKLKRLDYQR